MAFLSAHWLLILTLWSITHAVAQGVTIAWPAASTLGRVAHAWSALNPLDWVKFAAQLAPLMPSKERNAVEQAASVLQEGEKK
jgi:hypothetical protein